MLPCIAEVHVCRVEIPCADDGKGGSVPFPDQVLQFRRMTAFEVECEFQQTGKVKDAPLLGMLVPQRCMPRPETLISA